MSRLLTDTNSPTEQLRLTTDAGEGWKYDYLGRLRLDLVQFQQVTIPDSHLFDGALLLQLDPKGLVDDVRRVAGTDTSPLIINTREETLEDSLRQLLVRRDDPQALNPFVFKTLGDPDQARVVANAISAVPVDRLTRRFSSASAAEGLSDFLRDVAKGEGVEIDDRLDQTRNGWASWIKASQNGDVRTEKWTGRFNTAAAARATFYDRDDFPTMFAEFRRVGEMFRQERSFSSELDEYLAQLHAGASPSEQTEVAKIRDWERAVRGKALAMRHAGAYRMGIDDTSSKQSLWKRLTDTSSEQSQRNEPDFDYPTSFAHRLGRLSGDQFRGALNLEDLNRWWAERDRSSLNRVLEQLSETVEQTVDAGIHGTQRDSRLIEIDFASIVSKVAGVVAGAAAGVAAAQAVGMPAEAPAAALASAAAAGPTVGLAVSPVTEYVLRKAGREERRHRNNVRSVTEYFKATTSNHSAGAFMAGGTT